MPAPTLASRFSDIVAFSQGPTGTSYRATHKQSGQAGLLRLVPLAPLEAAERVRLKRELRKQTKLAHDGLAQIVDGGEQGQDLWLFRELVAGETVSQRIARLGRMSVADTLAVTAQVATALDELQRGGLLHRDVKPSHIVLEPREGGHTMARLIDAGIAGRIDTGAVFDLLGTPAYISPEQVGGKLVSFRSDLYALGCVMFEMLTGKPPFGGPDVKSTLEAHRTKEVPALEVELPPAALSLLRSLLAKEPRQRPFSAQQVRRVLEPLLAPGTPLPAVSFRPAGAALPAKSPAQQDSSEELALEELDLQEQVTGTVALPADEVDALVVHDSQPAGQPAAAAGARASTPQVAPAVATAAAPALAEPAVTPAPAPSPAKSPLPPAETPVAAAEAPPARRSVGFDVESLFDDEVPAEPVAPTSLVDTAPTQLYRRDAEGADALDIEPRAGGPVPEPEGPDPDATRVVARPTSGRRPAWVPLAVAAVLLLLIVIWATSGDEKPEAAETSPGAGDSEAAAAPPAASASDRAATAAPSAAAPGTAEPTPGPEGVTVAAAQQPGTGGASAVPAPTAAAAAGAQPAPATGAAGAGAGANGKAQAAAAAVAAPAQGEPAAAAPGLEPAADPALAPSGEKLGSSAGNRLSSQRDPRADRLAKAEELKLQARDHYKAGRYRDAAKTYEKATELNPQDAGAFAGLGASLLSNDDAKGAVDAYSKAVRLQPSSSGFHAALGRAYLSRGDRDRARAAYEKALQLNPQNGAAKTALTQLK